MIFSSESTDKIRTNLINLMESAIYCLLTLESGNIEDKNKITMAHNSIYKSMVNIVDENIANHFEFGYILDQQKRKVSLNEDYFRG